MSVVATCYECTDIGRVRPTNEDSALCFAPGVCLVADGMGGHAAGEVASSLLAHTVHSYLGTAERPWDEPVLLQSVQAANTAIRAEASFLMPTVRGFGLMLATAGCTFSGMGS